MSRSPVFLLPLLTLAAAGARAQQPAAPPPQPYVEELPGMGRPIDTAATAARRARLMDRLGDAVVVVPAARSRDGDYVQDSDFRQSNTFFYLSQLEQPAAWLVMFARAAGPDTVVLLLPERNPRMESWTGRQLGPGPVATRLTGVALTRSSARLDSLLAAQRARRVPVYIPLDRYSEGLPEVRRLRDDSSVTVRNLRPVVDSMRVVKDAAETAALRRAVDITAAAHRELVAVLRPGMFEYEMEAVIEGTFRRLGAERVGFPSIVGSGPNGTVLHYDVNRRRSDAGELVVVDVGAEHAQYTADVTRTYPVSGAFTPRQRAVYELVLGANQAVIDSVRPGVTLGRLNAIAREYLRANSGSVCGQRTCDAFLSHGIAHHIGMDVHDVGPGGMPLAPGMVFAVEPGLYFPDEGFGVRIEDDVLVTPSGCEVLSAGAPKTVAEIERLMQRAAPAPRPTVREE